VTTNSPVEIHDLTQPRRWLEDLPNPDTEIGAIALGIVFLIAAWIVGRMMQLAVHRYLDAAERAGADPTGIRFLGKLANLGVYIFAFMIYSHIIPALQHLGTAWLTSMGLVSVVVGLAAQSTLGNLISGVSLVLYRPFKLGDQLQLTGPKGVEIGTVESINLGNTVLRTPDDRRLVVPNSIISNQTCVNLSLTRKGAPLDLVFQVLAGTDTEAARKILTDIAKAHPKTVAVDGCNVTAVTGWSTEITLNVWSVDADTVPPLKSDILESVRKQFDAAGIKMV
jgi:small-conductance mechanosensitive channel